MNLSISKTGAFLRGFLIVVQAASLPLLTKAASGGQVTRADVVPVVLTAFVTGQAYISQRNATSAKEERLKVWAIGVLYIVAAILGALEKQIISGHVTQADAIMALLAGANALLAYMNKSLSIAKAQDAWDAQANLSTEPKVNPLAAAGQRFQAAGSALGQRLQAAGSALAGKDGDRQ